MQKNSYASGCFRISSFAFLYGLIRSSFWMASSLRDQQNTFCFISHKSGE